jgi:SpoIID/LytB domain protein
LLLSLILTQLPSALTWAQEGDPLRHSDRTASLYRDVLKVDGKGNPLLPLSVLARQEKVEVGAAGGVKVLGTGDGAVEVRLPGPVEVTVQGHKAGVSRWFVVLAEAPAHDFDTLRSGKALWKERGVALRVLGSGTTYSLAGRAFDTRVTRLCLDEALADEAAARQKADALGKQWGGEFEVHVVVEQPPQGQLVARNGSAEVRAADVLWLEAVVPGATLSVAGTRKGTRVSRELPGRVYVVVSGQGGLEVVNEAEVERMLEGVVASEIFHSAPDAALRSQAVAARTDMLAKVGTRHATDPFAICSEVHCQAYSGLEKVNPRIAQAVQDTRGLVLVDQDGRLVDAYYHAISGGHTEHNENVWPGRAQPALRGRPDVTSGDEPARTSDALVEAMLQRKDVSWAAASGMNADNARWTTVREAGEIQRSLASFGVTGKVKAMRVQRRGVSGRALEVALTLLDGTTSTIAGELRIRKALGGGAGPKGLRSALFVVRPGPSGNDGVPERWTFQGAGFGHGVGMDQTGAVGRAKAGQDFRTILQAYYQGSRIEKVY